MSGRGGKTNIEPYFTHRQARVASVVGLSLSGEGVSTSHVPFRAQFFKRLCLLIPKNERRGSVVAGLTRGRFYGKLMPDT